MRRSLDVLGVTSVTAAAVGFGTLGPLARFATDVGFTAVSFAVWRAIASAVALGTLLGVGVLIGRLRSTPWRAVPGLERVQLAAMGVFVAGTTLGTFSAFERIGVSLTLVVFYSYPILVALAAAPLYGERLGRRKGTAMAMASFGLVLLVVAPGSVAEHPGLDLVGVSFALVAAGCQVGYALVGSRGFASVPAFQAATILRSFSVLFYFVGLVPLILFLGKGSSLTEPMTAPGAWLLVLLAGVIGAALPTALLVAGYRRIGPTRGAVLMLIEPLTGVVLAALLLGERPSATQLIGGFLVLAGAALVQLSPASASARPAALLAE